MWERGFATIGLLIMSNIFMTLAWYGHLRAQPAQNLSLKAWLMVVLGSWGLAFFEYILQVPANRIGYKGLGGPFSLVALKVIQEAIALLVFVLVAKVLFRGETLELRHYLALLLVLVAVWLAT
jgi:uncharacterized protein (DUF486 family)